jgi:hypothetical protein
MSPTRTIFALAVGLALALPTLSQADAWERNKTVTNGQASRTVNRSGECVDGTCSGTTTRVGPGGQTRTLEHSVTRSDGGGSSTTTTGNGRTVTTNRSGSCVGGECSGTVTRVGPQGNTTTRSRSGSCDGQGNCASTTTITR